MRRFGPLVAVLTLMNGLVGCVSSERRPQADENLVRLLAAERANPNAGRGLAFADVALGTEANVGQFCERSFLVATRIEGGQPRESVTIQGAHTILVAAVVPQPKALRAGTYHVTEIKCDRYKSHTTLHGDYATFEVRAGELVNLGQLRVQVQSPNLFTGANGTAVTSVGPIREELLAIMRSVAPETTAKMVDRPMRISGSGTVAIRSL